MTENTRAFTRADVEQFFQKHYGALDYPKSTIESVALLPELTPPTWRLRYKALYHDNDWLYFTLIILQCASITGPYLNLVDEVELPTGFVATAAEDAEMEREKTERRARWQGTETA